MITACIIALISFWAGQYAGAESENTWNPFIVYSQLQNVEGSPYAWLSSGLYEESKSLRRAMMGGGLTAATGLFTWYLKGPVTAVKAVKFAANAWDCTDTTWTNWQRSASTQNNVIDTWHNGEKKSLVVRLGDVAEWVKQKNSYDWHGYDSYEYGGDYYNYRHYNHERQHDHWGWQADWSW